MGLNLASPELGSLAIEKIAAFRSALDPNIRLRRKVEAVDLSTIGLGAAVPLLIEPTTIEQLQSALIEIEKVELPWKILGAGSNLLLPDHELSCLVIRLGKEFSGSFYRQSIESISQLVELQLRSVSSNSEECANLKIGEKILVTTFGSAALMGVSRRTALQGLSGLEFAAGIPASIGGAVKMNAGAHGGAISDTCVAAYLVSPSGELRKVTKGELNFSYRHSSVAAEEIVIAAEFELAVEDREVVNTKRSSCLNYRKQTQPLHLPSAGSVFKNPLAEKLTAKRVEQLMLKFSKIPSAAELLEQVGLKGMRQGGVEFSELHANWLVKLTENACSNDALELIAIAQKRVEEDFGIALETEILRW